MGKHPIRWEVIIYHKDGKTENEIVKALTGQLAKKKVLNSKNMTIQDIKSLIVSPLHQN